MTEDRNVALVTGASKGVGRGIALGLADAGWDVGVNYNRDAEGAEQTAAGVRERGGTCWVYQADVGDADRVAGMFDAHEASVGRLDLMVNNAGVQTWCSLMELKVADWERTIGTNLTGTFMCTQRAARLMRERGGCIINIGSGANKAVFPNLVDYSASKGGIDQLTRVAAVELGPLGIRVNCVAPGAIEIERTKLEDPDYAGTWGSLTPMRRVGQVADVAGAVVYLASEAGSFVTGQTIYVDGGMFTQVPWPYELE